jgi:hypothetical protein
MIYVLIIVDDGALYGRNVVIMRMISVVGE